MLSDWVQAGGNLIAMRPDPQLAGLLGLTPAGATLSNAYLQVDTGVGPRARASSARRSSTTARPTATRSTAPRRSPRSTRTPPPPPPNPAVTLRSVGTQRRPGRRLHLRPRPLGRLHAPGQPRLVGGRARQRRRREPADPLRRPLLRRQARGRPARLGRPQQGRDPAGRRAAAPADQPDRADERGPQAAAAVLVPAARREGGGGDDRRRSRQRRHRGALQRSTSR